MLSSRTASAQTDNLRQYIGCNLGEKVSVEESDERAQPFVRSIPSAAGLNDVVVLHGVSLHIAYAGTPFVNFKAERLASFDSAKRSLLQNLRFLAEASTGMEAKTPRRSSLNGFDIHAINRTTLSGGVQSVYLLFRDADQTVVTLYILNTPREAPRFSTIEQYRVLRDRFVQTYTACVGKKLGTRPSGRVG
ncbi:MAG: hypothetical protein ACR2KM_07100 [Gemmatimonadaceae bacterium]